jgi:phosphoserine phosphatase RsbU/P
MRSSAFRALLQEYRTRRMARLTALVAAYGLVLGLAELANLGAAGGWWIIFWAALLVCGVYYLGRLIGFVRHRLLWRLRRRLIVTYLFIAFVPILLIVFLVGLGAFIINGQFAAFLVTQRLRNLFDELKQVNRVVVHEAHEAPAMPPDALLDHWQTFYVTELSSHASSYPGLEITLRLGSRVRAFRLNGESLPHPVSVPRWFHGQEFSGFVLDGGQIALRAIADTPTPEGDLLVILSQPFTPRLLDFVGTGIGPVGVLVTRPGAAVPGAPQGPPPSAEQPYVPAASIVSQKAVLPPAISLLDYKVYGASTLAPVLWNGAELEYYPGPVFVYASSRILNLNRELFETLGRYSRVYVTAFVAVAAVFLLIEIFALIVGVSLTRSMTGTVDHLYDATERVRAGDFTYRIGIPAGDQLSALGEAFDNMTASVQRLLRESQEKTRLESDLEIAREVQRQLFPRAVPDIAGLELHGVCHPARGVSGDYYDFLRLSDDRLGVALGDVSGKGISAALLMAAIQSSLRAQFYDGGPAGPPSAAASIGTAQVVRRLNQQLFESTPLEKYATFFYAIYDRSTRRLTYTNAGHLAPALFRQGRIERLEVGGTVLGLFAPVEFLQAEIQLQSGDVLMAFTDGLTEPENNYGEEFGEERLLAAAQRTLDASPEEMAEEIYGSVTEWTGGPELQDDMTLIVARATP